MKKVNYNKLGNNEVLGSLQVGDKIIDAPKGFDFQAIEEGFVAVSSDLQLTIISKMMRQGRVTLNLSKQVIDMIIMMHIDINERNYTIHDFEKGDPAMWEVEQVKSVKIEVSRDRVYTVITQKFVEIDDYISLDKAAVEVLMTMHL